MKRGLILLVVLFLLAASTVSAGDVVINGFTKGATAVGFYTIQCNAVGAGDYCYSSITFPGTVPNASRAPIWRPLNGSTLWDNYCPGTASNPQALSGYLCLYENANTNIATPDGRQICTLDMGCGPTGAVFLDNAPIGVYLSIRSAAGGVIYSNGTWAFTP